MWSDKESEKDYLNFGEVSQLAVDIVQTDDMLPLSIGIFGNWGAGKSSLLKLIEKQLKEKSDEYIIIQFDAWLYQGFDDAKLALLEVIATNIAKSVEKNASLFQKAKNLLGQVNGFRVLGLLAEGGALLGGIPTGGLLYKSITAIDGVQDGIQKKEEYDEAMSVANEIGKQADGIIKKKEVKSPPQQIDSFRKTYCELLKEIGKTLIVIIDNLDRCLPSNAIATLEAIRLFLFLNNTAFIIAADEEMIKNSVAKYFDGLSKRHQIDYLDKLIQIPIRVPKIGIHEMRAYLFMLFAIHAKIPEDKLEKLRNELENALKQSWKEKPIDREAAQELLEIESSDELAKAFERVDRIAPLLVNSPIIKGNPRIVKRLLNVVKMRTQIAQRRGIPLDEAIITKLVIFERCAGNDATNSLYQLIDQENGKPSIFNDLEKANPNDFPEKAPDSWKINEDIKSFVLQWSQLEPSLINTDLRAAVYLSRETMPISAYMNGLSAIGKEALGILVKAENMSSIAANEVLPRILAEEKILIMEGITRHLRRITDWTSKPRGFAGAILLAKSSPEAAKIFVDFLLNLNFGKKCPPWMNYLLKDEAWAKEVI